ncbi:RNA polymerase sigma factor [Chitinophaga nivalis]|uniref:Sigma-70 family RNA polymerase sigma factor n=1 Tax=Chitinophaga nivalis TaxID=2991709 RepID=A0ABT3IS77_9BACT|nr:sigma-70 family RNA polymerase sigma factor [Chitinophaga nivalis]MCW3463473.1 sigma-70 family RNA polymerase sigma factor [Chitinophaga nivalis]MCW3486837.1 sigma-70 family RNA polymerase sigma factor [Chitinophaga nivalis]
MEDKILLRAIAGGDETAFVKLFEKHRAKVYFVAQKLLKSDINSKDVLQDVFTTIWLNRESLHEVDNFEAYLYTMVRNNIYSRLRKQKTEIKAIRKIHETSVDVDSGTEESIKLRDLQATLSLAASLLTPQQKHVYHLSRTAGFSHDEIAAQLKISKETVKKHIMAANKIVQTFLRDQSFLLVIFLCVCDYTHGLGDSHSYPHAANVFLKETNILISNTLHNTIVF